MRSRIRIRVLDTRGELGPRHRGTSFRLLGVGCRNPTLQITLSEERYRLQDGVLRAADLARVETRSCIRAGVRDVLQLDSEEGVRERTGGVDPFSCCRRFMTHRGVFWIALGILE
jgi:hypothetical protein